jgi:hypothetical protein
MRTIAPHDQAARIAALIHGTRINVTNEALAQDGIHLALRNALPDIRREVRLSSRDRVDLMAGAVAVEVKVKSRQNRREILKQLERYAEHDEVKAIVLATAAAWPGDISELNGKPLVVASLTRGWL